MVSNTQTSTTSVTTINSQPYLYIGAIQIKQRDSLPTALLVLAERYAYLGIRYFVSSHTLVIMGQRQRDDVEMMQALTELAKLIPAGSTHLIDVTNRPGTDRFSYLLYDGAVYRLGNPVKPSRPRRLVIGVYRRRIGSGLRGGWQASVA